MRRGNWWIEAGACLLVAAAVIWLFRYQLLNRATLLGNHDRLHYFLTQDLAGTNAQQVLGRASAWNGATFMGYDTEDLPTAAMPLSPAAWLEHRLPRELFFFWAGVCTCVVMVLAGWAAYGALRALALRPWTAVVGALIYLCGTGSQIRFAQSDTSGLLLVLLPLGVALLARAEELPPWVVLGGMFAILTGTLQSSIGLLAAYVAGFLGLLTLGLAVARRQGRLLGWGVLAGIAASLVVLPRLWSVGRELSLYDRGLEGAGGFAAVYRFFNVRPWEFLRWLDDGIFGRFPSEAAALGNNINLSEGFQLYSATFGTFLALAALIRFRGCWLGVFRRGPVVQRLLAATLVAVPLLVCTRTGAHALYLLFLRASLLHSRIVILASLPAAWLAAAALDHYWTRASAEPGSSRRILRDGLAAGALAASLLGASAWIGHRVPPDLRLPGSGGPAGTCIQAWHPVWSAPGQLAFPRGLQAVRIAPTVIALAWRDDDPEVGRFEIAMQRDGGAWAVIGSANDKTYTVGDVAADATYVFSVCAVAGDRRSPPARATATSQVQPRPAASPPPPIWFRAGSIVKITLCALILAMLLAGARLVPAGHAGRRVAVLLLGALVAGQALLDADFRLNGPQTLTSPRPFAGDNFFNASPPLHLPASGQVAALRARLEADTYRMVFLVDPQEFFGYPVPYVAEAWQLRVVEGYLSGVPARLAALPWPGGVRGFRTISFSAPAQLPWALLGRLNVKYAVPLTPALYFAGEGEPGASAWEVRPIQNPEPVTPRAFFAARTEPAPAFSGDTPGPLAVPDRPEQVTTVEGLSPGRSWPTDGVINARFEGDEVTVKVTAADHERFLVLNEMYHPGWQATAGGRAVPVFAANTTMRGAVVPAGVAEMRFRFHPWADGRWSWVSRLAGFGLLALGLIWVRRARHIAPASA